VPKSYTDGRKETQRASLRDGETFAALCQIYISLLTFKKRCYSLLLHHYMVSATAHFLNTLFTCEVAFLLLT